MSLKKTKRENEEGVILCNRKLKKDYILAYLPDSFKRKLSKREIRYIEDAFYKAAIVSQKQEEQDYLDKMLI
ncbi:MAG: hypothetical protein NC923_07785 [Candidatus Omnitrophica bacterium]|nr:hypothetical protein [Candidatus Omnitrophota bacterium]